MPTLAQRLAQINGEASDHLRESLAALERANALRASVGDLTAAGRSDDGLVQVTLDGNGRIQQTRFASGAASGRVEELDRRFEAAMAAAREQLDAARGEHFAEVRPPRYDRKDWLDRADQLVDDLVASIDPDRRGQ
ncbi:MAG: YbaB/EbfC family nucleoid-associated protein [Bifidobacteriaceae bacterium]|jgi:DNA-binding protein YbaB|nr:YbaB/EbfC family nucleoid-associated protein [Bifidobacteriaceae bacterium]